MLPLTGFTAVVCAAMGILVGLAVRPVAPPADLAAAPVPDRAEVTHQQFADQRTVPVRFTNSRARSVASPGDGLITASRCRPGRTLRSGQSLGNLDEAPVLLLHTAVPIYRDLAAGARGRDVRALQTELDRLGLRIKITGYYGSMTTAAIKTLQRRAGAAQPTGRIAVGRVVWLPTRSVTPTSCEARLGDRVGAGTGWAKVDGGLVRVDLDLPDGIAPGKRTMQLYGQHIDLGTKSSTRDTDFLARVEATPEFAAHRRDGTDSDVTASVSLSKPLEVLKVPPAALFGIRGRHACVESGDQVVAVELVGSGLGASLVTSPTPLDSVDLGPAISATECSAGS